jgi:hypothetical protein
MKIDKQRRDPQQSGKSVLEDKEKFGRSGDEEKLGHMGSKPGASQDRDRAGPAKRED